MRTPYGNRPDDIKKAEEEHQKSMQSSDEIKQMLTGLAGHLVASHQQNQNMIGQLANATAQGHQQLAKAIDHTAAIASAPVEAIRDKTGRITGSRKVLKK